MKTLDLKKTKYSLQLNLIYLSTGDNNDIILVKEIKIRANRRFFNFIIAANIYLEIFTDKITFASRLI